MRRAYRVIAYLIAIEVIVQAMMIATGVAGLDHWIEHDHATVTKHVLDNNPSFSGSFGFAVHAINGELLIPLFAIALIVVSFFAKIPGGTRWALYIFGVIVVQVVLGVSQGAVPYLGLLHGANAFALLTVAALAGRRASGSAPEADLAGSVAA
jgi:heme A synthase